MRYLLDTNALIFFLYDNRQLSVNAASVIYGDDKLSVSIVSLWEIAIKSSIGKLKIKSSITKIAEVCAREQIELFPIKPCHIDQIQHLPQIHGDPFDRLIIAQAITEDMTLITKDKVIPRYDVKVLW